MLTVEDLGITTTLPDFCRGCRLDALDLDSTTLYANDEVWIRNHNITCKCLGVCAELYERIKKGEVKL